MNGTRSAGHQTAPASDEIVRTAGSGSSPAILASIAGSKTVEVLLTLIVYGVYAGVMALSLAPAAWLLLSTLPGIVQGVIGVPPLSGGMLRAAALGGMVLSGAFYAYLFAGTVVQSLFIRIVSLGLKPGRYPAISATTLRWLIFSGVATIAMRTVLPLIPVSFLINLFFRIVGCRMGRNVKINTAKISDAYLLTLGDDVVLGGDTDITCHLFEHNHLILQPVEIGSRTLIGARSYIAPGVRIGSDCVIGLSSYLRSGRVISDNTVVTSLAGIDVHTARAIERGRLRARA